MGDKLKMDKSTILPFDCTCDTANLGPRWKRWLLRFELYADSKNLILVDGKEDNCQRRRALLLHMAGEGVQDIFATLADTGTAKDYSKAVKALSDHFVPKTNTAHARHEFKNTLPLENETVSQYHVRLAAVAKDCDFKTDNDNQIRDQILFHCKSEYLQRRLLEEGDDLTLAKTLTLATECERVECRLKTLNVGKSVVSNVNKVSRPKKNKQDKTDIVCYRCGNKGHYGKDASCPARGKKCHKCQGLNHYSSMCKTKPKKKQDYKKQPKSANQVQEQDCDDNHTCAVNTAFATKSSMINAKLVNVSVGGISVKMLPDTGSSINIIDRDTWKNLKDSKIKCQYYKSQDMIKPYGSPAIPVTGKFECELKYMNKTHQDTFSIIDGHGEVPLLSGTAAIALGLISVNTVNSVDSIHLTEEYKDVFNGLGKLKNRTVKLHIKEDATPIAQPLRRVPFQLREKVKSELDELLKMDIIEPVNGPTPWVNPTVIVPKANGKIRLCLDMRQANEAIIRGRHPIPTVDEVLQAMNGATVFSKVDLRMGYHQLVLDQESREITTFVTHTGLYRYKRLFFGVNSATEQYQYEIQTALAGLQGVQNISDDIIVYGTGQEDHDKKVIELMNRLRECGLTVNKDKCQFNMDKLVFMGLLLSEHGIGPTESKVKAITDATEPKNASELRSFLGLAVFNARFIPDFATITEPLRRLTHQNEKYEFGERQKTAFQKLKTAMSEAKTLSYFDPKATTRLITDASPVGLGAVLIQIQDEKPAVIAYASKSLTPVERRYSQTEKEALGIVWACERFHQYIYGIRFELLTDHKPLETIYGKRSKPCARIERWVLRLQAYDFSVKHIPGKKNIADALSRLVNHKQQSNQQSTQAENYVRFVAVQATPVALTTREIEQASIKDDELDVIRKCLEKNALDKLPKGYLPIASELCVYGQLVLRGTRIVIPEQLRARTLALAHEGHLGIVNTKANLRSKVWWPGIDRQVERFVRSCHGCQLVAKPDPPEPIRTTELPPGPWQDLATDLLGPLPSGDSILVTVDYFSRFVEVSIVRHTSTAVIIRELDEIFARHGLPVTLKSDNGPQFRSEEFSAYCEKNNIKHVKVTARYAQANGEVERQNSSLVKRLKIAQAENKPWKEELQKYLLAYRSIPHATTLVSPAELLFNRKIRTKMPMLKERPASGNDELRDKDAENKGKAKLYQDEKRNAKPSNITLGDKVLVKQDKRDKLTTTFNETPHEVVGKNGNSLIVKAPCGAEYSRNTTHAKKFLAEDSDLSPEPPPPPVEATAPMPTATPATPAAEHTRPKRTITLPKKLQDYKL